MLKLEPQRRIAPSACKKSSTKQIDNRPLPGIAALFKVSTKAIRR